MNYKIQGESLRKEFLNIVYSFMQSNKECSRNNEGMRQSDIFRECGMDWGEKEN